MWRMNKMKIDWIAKISSRKLWAMIADFVVMLMIAFRAEPDTALQIGALIIAGAAPIAYILGESWIDAKRVEYSDNEEIG